MLRLSMKGITVFIAALALFMESLDSTIINTAIPAISQSLNAHPVDLKLALISYLLSLAIFTPISGWIADRFGTKKVFIIALSVFSLSSLWCGLSHNLTELAIARFLQGIGGALTLPVARLAMLRVVGKQHFIAVMAQVVMLGSIGVMIGPLLGGLISHYFSWQWIFWVNLPIGILSIVIVMLYLKNNTTYKVEKLDTFGFLLFGFGLACLVFSLSSFSDASIPDLASLTILLLSALLLTGYCWHSKNRHNAVIKQALFQSTMFRTSVLGNLFVRGAIGAVPFLIPLLLEVSFGYSAPVAGMLLAPIALGVLATKPFVMRFFRNFGYKTTLLVNTPLTGVVLFCFMFVNQQTPLILVALITFAFGVTMSVQYSAINALAYIDIKKAHYSNATSLMSTLQRFAQSFGLSGAAISIRLLSPDAGKLSLNPYILDSTFLAMGLIVVASTFLFRKLDKNEGIDTSSEKQKTQYYHFRKSKVWKLSQKKT